LTKAAAYSLTQALRESLAGQGTEAYSIHSAPPPQPAQSPRTESDCRSGDVQVATGGGRSLRAQSPDRAGRGLPDGCEIDRESAALILHRTWAQTGMILIFTNVRQ